MSSNYSISRPTPTLISSANVKVIVIYLHRLKLHAFQSNILLQTLNLVPNKEGSPSEPFQYILLVRMLHLLKMCNAHHKSNATQECHNLKDRLPEAGVFQQLRDDWNGGDVNESTSSEGQDPRDGGLVWYDSKDVRGKLRFWCVSRLVIQILKGYQENFRYEWDILKWQ